MTLMEKEILEQAAALNVCADANATTLKEIAAEIKTREIDNIVVAARGSSNNASVYFKYLCETFLGLPVSFAAPSVVTLYNGALNLKHSMVIAVSQSGKAEDVLAVISRASYTDSLTIGVTNDPDSPIAAAVKYHLFMSVGEEKSVAATKTFTAEMYLLGLLVAYASDNKNLKKPLKAVPDKISEIYAMKDDINELSKAFTDKKECYILSRGYMYSIGLEAALKLQETTYTNARAYAISDFYHGPFAILNEDSNVILLAPVGKVTPDYKAILKRIKEVGANITVFSDDVDLVSEIPNKINMPYADEITSPFIYAVAVQIFACCLSERRGLNPDAPRGLKKVTVTL